MKDKFPKELEDKLPPEIWDKISRYIVNEDFNPTMITQKNRYFLPAEGFMYGLNVTDGPEKLIYAYPNEKFWTFNSSYPKRFHLFGSKKVVQDKAMGTAFGYDKPLHISMDIMQNHPYPDFEPVAYFKRPKKESKGTQYE